MKKVILATVLALCTLNAFPGSTPVALAFDPVAAAGLVAGGVKGVSEILNAAGVSQRKAKWVFGGMHHTWWVCVYQDGTQVWNNFRSYRSAQEVFAYYTGQSQGDCDSRGYDPNLREFRVCYPRDCRGIVRRHGPIVRIYAHGPAD